MAKENTKETVNLAEKEAEALRKGKTIREDYSRATDILIKKQNQLNDLQAKQNELEKDSLKNQNEIIENKKQISKTQLSIEVTEKNILRLEEKAKKNQEELKKYREEREKSEKESEKRTVEAEKVEKRLLDLKRGTNVEMNLAADLMNKIGGSAADLSKISGVSNSLFEQQTNILAESENILKNQGFLTEDFVRSLEDGKTVTQDISSLEAEILSQTNDASVGKYKSVDLSRQETLLKRKLVELQDESSGLTGIEKDQAILLVKAQQDALATLKKKNTQLEEMSKQSEKTLGVFEKFSSFDFKGGIRQYFGLDQLKSDMKDKLGKTVLEVTEAVRGPKGLVGGFKAAASGLGGMIKMAPRLAIGLGVAGIAAGIGLLVKSVMHADEEVANLGKEFGISYNEARGLHHAAVDISNAMGVTGINAAEVTKAMGDVSEMMGGIDIAAQMKSGNKELTKLVEQTAVLTKQFGMSGEEVGKIHDIATITGTSMDNLVKESVELGKGTMTAKQSLKVLSSIPPQVAVAFKGSTKELIAAAQKAKLLGMELGKVQSIGRGMLEIETSLEAEMEARVMTGKNLNLDAARMYALQGDTFKLQEEILNQAGSLEDFTKMNTLQQESMAKALGMSVEEMTKMLTSAEKLKKADISSDYAERLQAMESAADLEKEAANARSKEQKDYILQLAAEKRSTSLKETMASLMEKIKQKFAPIIDAVLEFVGGIKDGTGGVSKFEEIISKIDFNEIAGQIKEFLPKLVEGFGQLMKNLPSIIKMITNFVSKLGGAVGPASSLLGSINPSIAGFGIMALKIGGPKGVVEGLKLASGGAMKLFDVVKGPLMSGISSLAGGVSGKLGGAFSKVADKAKTGLGSVMEKMGKVKTPEAPKAGGGGGFLKSLTDAFKNVNTTDLIKAAAAMLILAAALYVVAKALQEFGSVEWESVAKGGVTLLGLVGIAYLLSKVAGDMITGAAAMVILGAALYVAAKAMQEFSTGVSWEGVLMGIVTLGALTLAVLALGALMMSGVGGAAILAGAAALLILSAALWVMGKAMQEFAKAAVIALPFFDKLFSFLGPIIQGFAGILMAIADGITTVAASIANAVGGFVEIAKTDPSKLFTIAGGITAIGVALAALGAGSGGGSIASGLGNLLGGLMGGDSPMEMLTEITKKLEPEKLSATAIAIRELADAFKYFAEETAKLKDFDTDKLETIIEKMEDVKEAQSGGIGGAITGAANAVTGFLGNIFGSSETQKTQPVTAGAGGGSVAVASSSGGTNMANVEKKLDTLISVISQAANQPLVIKFGEKTVEEIKTQLNFKKITNIGVDKGYGKSV